MRRPFLLIFFGLLLVSFDFTLRLNSLVLHLLPDSLGYLLMAVATKTLATRCPPFRLASIFGWVLVATSIAGYFISGGTVWHHATIVIHCFLIWFLLGGIIVIAQRQQRDGIVRSASIIRVLYVVLRIVPLLLRGLPGPIIALTALAFWLVLGTLLYLVFQMRNEPDFAADV